MVRHQGRVIWRGHLGGKKSRLERGGGATSRGELGFRWEPGKGSSGCHLWVKVVEAAVQQAVGVGAGITGWEHGALGVRMWLGWGLGVVSWGCR